MGRDGAEGLKDANANLPHLAAQLRTPLHWTKEQIADNLKFLLGAASAAIDAQFYYLNGVMRGRWQNGPTFLSEFKHLEQWQAPVANI